MWQDYSNVIIVNIKVYAHKVRSWKNGVETFWREGASDRSVGAISLNVYLPNYNEVWATFIEEWRGIRVTINSERQWRAIRCTESQSCAHISKVSTVQRSLKINISQNNSNKNFLFPISNKIWQYNSKINV